MEQAAIQLISTLVDLQPQQGNGQSEFLSLRVAS